MPRCQQRQDRTSHRKLICPLLGESQHQETPSLGVHYSDAGREGCNYHLSPCHGTLPMPCDITSLFRVCQVTECAQPSVATRSSTSLCSKPAKTFLVPRSLIPKFRYACSSGASGQFESSMKGSCASPRPRLIAVSKAVSTPAVPPVIQSTEPRLLYAAFKRRHENRLPQLSRHTRKIGSDAPRSSTQPGFQLLDNSDQVLITSTAQLSVPLHSYSSSEVSIGDMQNSRTSDYRLTVVP